MLKALFSKTLENFRLYVKVKESFNNMITSVEQEIKKVRSNFFEKDLKNYLLDKIKITKFPKSKWYKGSRYR